MKSIRSRIMAAMLGLAFGITVSLSSAFAWYILKNTESTVADAMLPLSKQTASNFDYITRDYVGSFENFALSSEYASCKTDAEKIEAAVETFDKNEMINDFAVYDNMANIKASKGAGCADVVKSSDIMLANKRGEVTLTAIRSVKGERYFGVLVPVTINGKYEIAAAVINCKLINDSLKTSAQGLDKQVFVADEDGNIIFSSNTDSAKIGSNPIEMAQTNKKYKSFCDVMKMCITGDSGTASFKYEDKSYTAGYAPTTFLGSTLVITTPTQGHVEISNSTIRIIVLVIILIVAITILVSIWFAKRISKPIVATTKRLRQLSNGDIATRVDVWYSKDELGVLSNSLEETVANLRQYINLISVALQQIAEGNLSHRMEGNFKGDFAKIKTTFNEIFVSLSQTFDSINYSASQVTSGAVQVSNSAQSLSQGATQQASAIEELSATLSGVAQQVMQNSKGAKDAFEIVNENSAAITGCNEDMMKMLEAMKQITQTSDEIASIIKVIDEISFQTNILALNAAVEAAREGSKGFGVVADEVRQLASRSAGAAKQTAALIQKAAAAVDQGSEIAKETARSLEQIVESSNKIRGLVGDIAEASEEQTSAIMQINTGVDQISEVVSANTSAAVDSASASEELSGQSLILKNMIAKFRLQESRDDEEEDEDDEPDDEISEIKINLDDNDDKY